MSNNTIKLPNGDNLFTRVDYKESQAHGIMVLVAASCFSLIAVVGLLAVIAISAFNTRTSLDKHLFVKTHVAIYFLCLLSCDFIQAIASIMNATWINAMGVYVGPACTLQGILKQVSDVGTSFWTLIIAIHTFCLLVLELRLRKFILYTTLAGGWSLIGFIVVSGPALHDEVRNGPYYTISGYWCWISPEYGTERVTADYLIMFLVAFFSFVLYTLIFLKLRGNLVVNDWKFRFRRVSVEDAASWKAREPDDRSLRVARQMILYPIAYTVILLPMAVVRFMTWAGHEPAFAVTIFSDVVFLLSGVVNVALFASTRHVLPPKSVRIPISIGNPTRPKPKTPTHPDYDPYYAAHHQPQFFENIEVQEEKAEYDPREPNFLIFDGSQSPMPESPEKADYSDINLKSPPGLDVPRTPYHY